MTFPSIKKNYAINALLTLVNLAYPFATLAYLARIIGPGYLGKYYVASSLVTYFLFAASLGIPMYGTREIGRHRDDKQSLGRIFSELAVLNALSSIAFGLVFLAVTFTVPEFRKDWPLFLILGAMLPLNALSIDFLFLGLENQSHIAKRTAASKAVSLVCLFALVRSAEDFLWYAAVTTGGLLLYNLAALPYALRTARIRLDGLNPARHLRPLLYLLLTVLAANVYLNLDSVVLGLLAGETSVGYYNSAMRLARTSVALVTAVGVTVIPRLTYHLNAGNDSEYRSLLAKSFDLICLTAVPGALMLAFCAPGIINLIFGPGFRDAVPVLELAAPLVLLTGFTHFLGLQVLFPKGDEKLVFYSSLAAAAASLTLNLILAPRFHEKGAVLAALSAESLVLALQWQWARRRHGQGLFTGIEARKYLIAGAAMSLPLAAFRVFCTQPPAAVVAALFGSGAVYLGVLWLVKESHVRSSLGLLANRFRR